MVGLRGNEDNFAVNLESDQSFHFIRLHLIIREMLSGSDPCKSCRFDPMIKITNP